MAGNNTILRRLDDSGVPLLGVRLLLGGLFVYMGWSKAGDPFAFLKQIYLYEALPESPAIFINSVAIVLPWLEIIAGIALILGVYVRGAAATIALMLAVFTPAIFLRAMVIRTAEGTPFFEIAFDCGCGGGPVIIWRKLLDNGGLFLLSVYGIFSCSRRFCLGSWLRRRRGGPDACARCGKPLPGATGKVCEGCAESSLVPTGS